MELRAMSLNGMKGCAVLALVWTGAANAIPTAQLDILGGGYDTTSQTVFTSKKAFSLYAYGNADPSLGTAVNTSLNWYVSVALSPKVEAAQASSTNFGSFDVDGMTYDASDFVFGTPPLESMMGYQPFDLRQHGIFDTLYMTLGVTWNPLQSRSAVNVRTEVAGTDPLANPGSALMFDGWNFDISGLLGGYNLHFDLFGVDCSDTTFDTTRCAVLQYASFHHDAETTSVPEPEVLTLLGFGLLLVGFASRCRQRLQG